MHCRVLHSVLDIVHTISEDERTQVVAVIAHLEAMEDFALMTEDWAS